jgi:hypothetical protein
MKRRYKGLICTSYKGLSCISLDRDGRYWALKEYWTDPTVVDWRYGIAEYAFVPGYNVIDMGEGESSFSDERVISNHKTLTEAEAILRLLQSDPANVWKADYYE